MVLNFRGDTKVSNKKKTMRKVAAAVGVSAILAAGAYTKHQNTKAQKDSLHRLQGDMIYDRFRSDVAKSERFKSLGGVVPKERRPDLPSTPIWHDVRHGDFKNQPPRAPYGSRADQRNAEKFRIEGRRNTIKPPHPDLPKLKTASEFQALLRKDIHLTRPPTGDPWYDQLADVMSR